MERKQNVGKRKKSKNSITSSSSIPIPKSLPNHSIQHKKSKSSHNQMIITSNKSIDLPCIILIEILGRLPIKTLISCKFVCKSWRSLLTESYFYKLYSYHMPTTLILQIKGSSLNTLKQIHYIESSSCTNTTTTTTNLMKKLIFIKKRGKNNKNQRNQDLGYLNGPDFRFQLGNSCNGFVCIREIGTREPTLVWNPMMGQFAVLPKPANTSVDKVVAGFGFCGRTNKYKVLRIFHKNLDPQFKLRVEIYELGVGDKWRGIGDAPFPIPSRIPGFYTNNSIHWIMDYEEDDELKLKLKLKDETANSELICAFDFIEEKFKVVTPPPIYSVNERNKYHWSNLGMLANCLSVCAIDAKIFRADVQVWVMEEYGVPESWNMRLSIRDPTVDWWDPHRWMQVTNFGTNGEIIIMLCAHSFLLAYSVRDRQFRSVEGLKFPAIALLPSLISLEDVLCQQEGTGSLKVMYL